MRFIVIQDIIWIWEDGIGEKINAFRCRFPINSDCAV